MAETGGFSAVCSLVSRLRPGQEDGDKGQGTRPGDHLVLTALLAGAPVCAGEHMREATGSQSPTRWTFCGGVGPSGFRGPSLNQSTAAPLFPGQPPWVHAAWEALAGSEPWATADWL